MQKLLLYILFLSTFFSWNNSHNIDPLSVGNIDNELLDNANQVIRYSDYNVDALNTNKVILSVSHAETFLNENAINNGVFEIQYSDGYDKLKKISIEILDKNGALIKKVRKKEIRNFSAYDGYTIASNERIKYFEFKTKSYPFTIRYSYEMEMKNTAFYPAWTVIPYPYTSVESTSYNILSDQKINIQKRNLEHYNLNFSNEPLNQKFTNLKAFKYDKLAPHYLNIIPFIRFYPTKFNYYGIPGEFEHWNSYGKWIYENMLKERKELPLELIAEIESLIPLNASQEKKARIIYDYVTSSTRYVSVQLGAGGFMPFSAEEVYKLKYGDCKALSNYTVSIMSHFGINAKYVEIYSDRKGDISYDPDICGPGQGNHIVVCLPEIKDTTWLECTAKVPFGLNLQSTDNRNALLIDETGGYVVKTKGYNALENVIESFSKIEIDDSFQCKVSTEIKYYNQNMIEYYFYKDLGDEEIGKHFKTRYKAHYSKIENLEFDIETDENKFLTKVNNSFQANNYLERVGNYLFVPISPEIIPDAEFLEKNRDIPIFISQEKQLKIEKEIKFSESFEIITKSLSKILCLSQI